MAEYALPPGAVRRRAVFGLLDADGWTWATIKAAFWFVFIIFVLGYVPDRAYYFTVSPTIDLGYNAISPINLCPAANKSLPCPAPAGAIIPWEASPSELALPSGRTAAGTFSSGTNLYLIGGQAGGTPTASVLSTTADNGNIAPWTEGPALPEPRAGAVVLTLAGVPYVVGGADASGNPTDTVFEGTVDQGSLTGWTDAGINLPVPLTDASGVATATSLYVFGGRTADGSLSAATYHAAFPANQTKLAAWQEMTEIPLPEARAGATAVSLGISVYVVGGEGPNGVTNSVFYLGLDAHGNPAVDEGSKRPLGWGVSVNQSASAALPEPRQHQTSFANGGAIYVIGGQDANGAPAATNYWSEPNASNGLITTWSRLDATDLPQAQSLSAAAVSGSTVFLIGGSGANGEDLNTVQRASLAAEPPFFRAGLFGVTVPALSIKGEIGQQLGYIIAAGAGTGGLITLIIIGWAFSHRRQTFRFLQWVTRGRFRAPPEDEYNL
jgi:N-acetylneuraminic acid mutarotase